MKYIIGPCQSIDSNSLNHGNTLELINSQAQQKLTAPQKKALTLSLKRVPTHQFSESVLQWFDQHGRKSLPWQINPTPYRVWISEVMLQQTQVSTVLNYFNRFLDRFKTVSDLAQAPIDEVLSLWTGLGYYSRARNLHKSAKIVHEDFNGKFPLSVEALEKLPGIGRSTAGAIISLSSNQWAPILDGNVKRVLSRVHCVQGPIQETKVQHQLWALASNYTPKQQAKAFNQAMMDLGAGVCTRTKPMCDFCPVSALCGAYAKRQTESYPQKKIASKKPTRSLSFLILKTRRGSVLLEKRPEKGIWGGLWGLPEFKDHAHLQQHCSHFFPQAQCHLLPKFSHVFTHFKLIINPAVITLDKQAKDPLGENYGRAIRWFNTSNFDSVGLATPVKKLLDRINTIGQ